MAFVQKFREAMAQIRPKTHRRFEKELLDIARHVAPELDRGIAEQQSEGVFLNHAEPPLPLRPLGPNVPEQGARKAPIEPNKMM
jgi:hypothetical protein